MFIGVNNLARKIKGSYVGVNGVARKVKAIYVGVNGVARLVWQSIKNSWSRYVSVNKSNDVLIASPSVSGSAYGYAYNSVAERSQKSSNVAYVPFQYTVDSVSTTDNSFTYLLLKVDFNSSNQISNIAQIPIGTGSSWTDYSGNYGATTISPDCIFEFGDYVFYSKTHENQSSGSTTTTYSASLCNFSNLTGTSTTVPGKITSGVAFNDTVAVTNLGYNAMIALVTRNGTSLSLKQYYLAAPNGNNLNGAQYYSYFKIVKLSNTKGAAIGYGYVYNYSTGLNTVGLYVCPFNLSSDGTSLTFGTTVYHSDATILSNSTQSKFFTIDKDNIGAFCYYRSGDNTSDYIYVNSLVIKIDDNLNVTFTTKLNESKYGYYERIADSNSVITSYESSANSNFGFYVYDMSPTGITKRSNVIYPDANNSGTTGYFTDCVSLGDGRVIRFDTKSVARTDGSYYKDIYINSIISSFS